MTGRTIYRDTERAKIAGVVAGLSEHFGWKLKWMRIGWIVATVFWPPVMIAAYILMAWLLDPLPGQGRSSVEAKLNINLRHENRDGASPLRYRFLDARDSFSRLEQRLRSLEKVVTSREFQMDRELRRGV